MTQYECNKCMNLKIVLHPDRGLQAEMSVLFLQKCTIFNYLFKHVEVAIK